MIIDKQNFFSNAVALTTTADSDIIDQTKAGDAEPAGFIVQAQVGTALAGGTSLLVELKTSADNSTYVLLASSGVIATANLTAGAVLMQVNLPRAALRYLKLVYTIVGTFTSGTINAFVTPNGQTQFNQ